MRNTITPILFLCALSGCHRSPEKSRSVKDQNGNMPPQSLSKLTFGEIQQIDSSGNVIYPLELKHDNGGFKSMGASTSENAYDWNILFLNTQTHKYHLLDSARKMFIKSYYTDQPSTVVIAAGGHTSYNKHLYYVITTNLNKDRLGGDYPEYLFMSDIDGSNFKQISPDNFDVRSWKVMKEVNKVLISAVYMKPGDKRDYDNDEIKPFIYDLTNGTSPQQVFDAKFIEKTKALFDKEWLEKK